jgi:hypothetical protein
MKNGFGVSSGKVVSAWTTQLNTDNHFKSMGIPAEGPICQSSLPGK